MKSSFALALGATILWHTSAPAEVPLLSTQELQESSSHIVVGEVLSVFSKTNTTGDWQETRSVAEISVLDVEKGGELQRGSVVYARYWNKKWIGDGDPEPHASGHRGTDQGDVVRAHLRRKEGVYHVLLPNGLDSLEDSEAKSARSSSDALARDLDAVQGTWVRTVQTNDDTVTITKQHIGNKTILTVEDSFGRLLEQKESEFRLENTGKVRIFTFFNNRYTAGPNAGRVQKASSSYLYRVTDNAFVEIRGVMIGDPTRPVAFSWQRVSE